MRYRHAYLCALACSMLGSIALAQSKSETHALLLVRSEQGVFRIVGRRELPSALPRSLPRPAHQGWSFQALDAQGGVMHTGALPNPHIVRGDFRDELTGKTSGVQFSSAQGVTFSIRVPSAAKTVVLYGIPTPIQPVARGAARSAAPNNAVLARIAL